MCVKGQMARGGQTASLLSYDTRLESLPQPRATACSVGSTGTVPLPAWSPLPRVGLRRAARQQKEVACLIATWSEGRRAAQAWGRARRALGSRGLTF